MYRVANARIHHFNKVLIVPDLVKHDGGQFEA
jgi:hypothetical protein